MNGASPGQAGGVELLTVGHGTLTEAAFGSLLTRADVDRLIDIRRAPGSRRHPHFGRDRLAGWVAALGIEYSWEPGLGGWRRPAPDSPNPALRNDSFRGYADYMRTPPFWTALDGVLAEAGSERSAVMCSEAVYWRCHRRLVADAAELIREVTVWHLSHDGRLVPHRPTDGVRVDGRLLAYDHGTQTLPTA
jgi:uncharacterized protein (DUF488 family)